MKRIALAILAIAFVIGSVAPSFAVEMQARGSWRAAATMYDFSSVDDDGNAETFKARQRARLWFDFIANENLKAVLGLEIGDTTWGNNGNSGTGGFGNAGGSLGTDGVNIETKHAYIQFNLPNTQVSVTAGLQPIYIPGNLGSPIMDDDAAALMVSTPINDMVSVAGGWIRAIDLNDNTKTIDLSDGTDYSGDEVDTLALLVPVKADGFSVTPYFLYTMIGQNTLGNLPVYDDAIGSAIDDLDDVLAADNAGITVNGLGDDATMWHAGFSAQIDMFDPIVIMTDFAYGSLSLKDVELTRTNNNVAVDETEDIDVRGFFFDLAVDYKMDFMTPELFFLYTSGAGDDDDTISVFPYISGDLNFSSFVFDGSVFTEGDLNDDPSTMPMWAIGLKLKDISFVEDLSHTFTIYYAQGTSDKDGWYGATFAEDDSLIEVNFDSKYQIYDELAAYLELGYVNFDWDDKDIHADNREDGYKAALGIKYDF